MQRSTMKPSVLVALLAAVLLVPWPSSSLSGLPAHVTAASRTVEGRELLTPAAQRQQQQQSVSTSGSSSSSRSRSSQQPQRDRISSSARNAASFSNSSREARPSAAQGSASTAAAAARAQARTPSSSKAQPAAAASPSAIEAAQYAALQRILPQLFVINNQTWEIMDGFFASAPENLKSWIPASVQSATQDYSAFISKRGQAYISLTATRINNTVYITEVYAYDAGLDLRRLPDLLRSLPKMAKFTCSSCFRNWQSVSGSTLPVDLPVVAPKSFKFLSLGGCKIQGNLPESWGSWKMIEQILVWNNDLTGSIPESWSNMKNLKVLYAESNRLQGPLPESWGSGKNLPENLAINLHNNPQLTGSIPQSWGRFTGVLDVSNTNVTGCVPDELLDNVLSNNSPEACSLSDPNKELTALTNIRDILRGAWSNKALASWVDDDEHVGKVKVAGGPPKHCTSWAGVTCDLHNKVTALHLSNNRRNKPEAVVQLPDLMQQIKRLNNIQYLNLSHLGLNGSLSDDRPLMNDISNFASDLPRLQVLDLSHNPGLTGELPRMWAGLTALQILDVSGTNIQSTLPSAWATLQSLTTFKASNTQIYGSLPDSWGMLKNMVELDISNTKITGRLPTAWADPLAMRTVAVAALADAKQDAAVAAAAAADLKHALGFNSAALQDGALHDENIRSQQQQQQDARRTDDFSSVMLSTDDKSNSLMPVIPDGNMDMPPPDYYAPATASSADSLNQQQQQQQQQDKSPMAAVAAVAAAAAGSTTRPTANRRQISHPRSDITNPRLATAARSVSEVVSRYHNAQDSVATSSNIVIKLQQTLDSLTAPASIASSTGLGMSNLQVLRLHNNMLSGTLPAEFSSFGRIRVLELSGNMLSGTLPMQWAAMDYLEELYLNDNQMLTGFLPDYWARLTNLRTLDLHNNSLSGELPMTWIAMQNVETIDLSDNKLMGTVPPEWEFMSGPTYKLRCLVLHGNAYLEDIKQQQTRFQNTGGRVTVVTVPEEKGRCNATSGSQTPMIGSRDRAV